MQCSSWPILCVEALLMCVVPWPTSISISQRKPAQATWPNAAGAALLWGQPAVAYDQPGAAGVRWWPQCLTCKPTIVVVLLLKHGMTCAAWIFVGLPGAWRFLGSASADLAVTCFDPQSGVLPDTH